MEQPLKAVNFYKRALLGGFTHNMEAGEGLELRPLDPSRPAAYVTRMFDTGDEEGGFNRLTVDGAFGGTRLEVIVAAWNMQEAVVGGQVVALDDYFADPDVPVEDKQAALLALPHVRAADAADLLLHALEGRYVWVCVQVFPAGECGWVLRGMRLEFPRESFTGYFPEIYREDEFFDRFIAVFQSLYLDLERRVDELPRLLDYETASDQELLKLADWLGLDTELFTPAQLRTIIGDLDLYQGKKGTRAALEAVLLLTCGTRPRIVERFQWESLSMPAVHRALCDRLYGGLPGSFCVLFPPGDYPEPQAMERLIGRYSPIGTPHKLALLKSCSRADDQCYLDYTAELATPGAAKLDGSVLDEFVALG